MKKRVATSDSDVEFIAEYPKQRGGGEQSKIKKEEA